MVQRVPAARFIIQADFDAAFLFAAGFAVAVLRTTVLGTTGFDAVCSGFPLLWFQVSTAHEQIERLTSHSHVGVALGQD